MHRTIRILTTGVSADDAKEHAESVLDTLVEHGVVDYENASGKTHPLQGWDESEPLDNRKVYE